MKEGLIVKHYVSDQEMITAAINWLKEQSTGFYKSKIHAPIKGGTLIS